MSKAVVFFADGTEECEALLVVDLLRRAKVEVLVASAMGRKEVVSSHKIHLTTDAVAEEIDYSDVDMVVLPGGIPGTPNIAANKTVTDTCVSFAKAGKKVAAICAAPSILASLGLLEGRHATAHAGFQDQLAGAIVHDQEVVVDGSITAMASAVPSPSASSWCASSSAPKRPTASRTPSPIGIENGGLSLCALSPAVCRTGSKIRPFCRRTAHRSGR